MEELAAIMPNLSEQEQHCMIGGGHYYSNSGGVMQYFGEVNDGTDKFYFTSSEAFGKYSNGQFTATDLKARCNSTPSSMMSGNLELSDKQIMVELLSENRGYNDIGSGNQLQFGDIPSQGSANGGVITIQNQFILDCIDNDAFSASDLCSVIYHESVHISVRSGLLSACNSSILSGLGTTGRSAIYNAISERIATGKQTSNVTYGQTTSIMRGSIDNYECKSIDSYNKALTDYSSYSSVIESLYNQYK